MPAREQKGVPFEIVSQDRGKVAAQLYRYSRWFSRRHRGELEKAVLKALTSKILYGYASVDGGEGQGR